MSGGKKDRHALRHENADKNFKKLKKLLKTYKGTQRLGQLIYNSLRVRGADCDARVGDVLFTIEDEALIERVRTFTENARNKQII